MKTKITLGLLVLSSLMAVIFGLKWVHNISAEQDISAYFSEKKPIYIFYRPSECSVNDLEWEINKTALLPLFEAELSAGKWKSILAQQGDKNQFTLVFEQNRTYSEEYVDALCSKLKIRFERKLLSVHDLDNTWNIKDIGSYIVISNIPATSDVPNIHTETLAKRDRNASFACIIDGEIQEYYCFPNISKSFVNQKFKDFKVHSSGSMDFDMYNVVPKSVSQFEYMDKDLLLKLYPKWKSSPLIEYVESGLLFSTLDQVNFIVLPISELFSAKDILESLTPAINEENLLIKVLVNAVPDHPKIHATVLENYIILSRNQATLESISLAYQMQQGFNTTDLFEQISKYSSEKVHHRWYNSQQMFQSNQKIRLSFTGVYGYSYFRNRDKTMRFVSVGVNEKLQINNKKPREDIKIAWNFSLKNLESTFHLNASPIVGVYNPADRSFSLVDGNGQIANAVTPSENIKSIHPLERGFLLETFEKLYWVSEQNQTGQRDYAFKGQIQSTIASYTWNREEYISFISEQKLHKFSLNTGKTQLVSIPVSINSQQPKLHAFNHKGKLRIGYFNNSFFYALDLSNNRWNKEPILGEVQYSEKINGKIHFVENSKVQASHKVLYDREQQVFNVIKPKQVRQFKNNLESTWVLQAGRDFYIYSPQSISGNLVTIPNVEITSFEPVYSGSQFIGMLILDDVQSEVFFFKRLADETELSINKTFRGSKFIKFTGNKRFVTMVDGQLVAYDL